MIKQFSTSIDKIQDRMLLRFNTAQNQEFRFWITRRNAIELLDSMPRHSEQSKDIISNFEKSLNSRKQKLTSGIKNAVSLNKDENKKLFETEKNSETNSESQCLMPDFISGNIFPTGKQAVLVKEIRCKLVKKFYNIQFYLENNKRVNFSLSLDTFLTLHSLIEMTAKKANWNIEVPYFSEKTMNKILN